MCPARIGFFCQMRVKLEFAPAVILRPTPHLSNYKAFLDDDVTAERRYSPIETFNYRDVHKKRAGI